MKKLFYPLAFVLLAVAATASAEQRVAMLISGYGNQGNERLSYDLEELAQSYLVLTKNGIQLDLISPNGGEVPVHNKKDDLLYIQQFKTHTPALKQLKNTLSAKQALSNTYDGLIIIGGDGAMFDLPFHANTQQFILKFINQQQPVAAVCHGPAALVNLKLENGEYFLKGKRVNSFTQKEEMAFSADLIDKFPFMLQAAIESRGATFVSNNPMLPFVAEDAFLITAQNPMSVAKATEALVVKLGITPTKRELFKDEATLQLISQARSEGAYLIDIALAKSSESYDINYLALYGFYAYKLAETKEDKLTELRIMEQISQHFSHPQYSLALIQANLEQQKPAAAKKAYARLIKQHPEFEVPLEVKQQLL